MLWIWFNLKFFEKYYLQKLTLEKYPLNERPVNVNGLKVALKQRADQNGQIILLTIDNDYTEMAMNFYLTSLQKFNIENYLFLTTDTHATQVSWIETVITHVLAIYIYICF